MFRVSKPREGLAKGRGLWAGLVGGEEGLRPGSSRELSDKLLRVTARVLKSSRRSFLARRLNDLYSTTKSVKSSSAACVMLSPRKPRGATGMNSPPLPAPLDLLRSLWGGDCEQVDREENIALKTCTTYNKHNTSNK